MKPERLSATPRKAKGTSIIAKLRVKTIKDWSFGLTWFSSKLGIRNRKDLMIFSLILIGAGFIGAVFFSSILTPFYEVSSTAPLPISILSLACTSAINIYGVLWIVYGFSSLFYKMNNKWDTNSIRSPKVSVLIPCHNEEKVVKNIVSDLRKQDYPHLQIIAISHNCTDKTPLMIEKESEKDERILHLQLSTANSGKALALNHGLKYVNGDIIAQYDADNRIRDRTAIRKAVAHFVFREETDALQTRLETFNPNRNFLTRVQELEYQLFSHLYWAGKNVLKQPCLLGGTGIFFRKELLDKVGGWRNSLVEDFQMYHELKEIGANIVYADDVETVDEKPATWSKLIKQRSRWTKGHILTMVNQLFRKRVWCGITDLLYLVCPVLANPAWFITSALVFYSWITRQWLWHLPVSVWVSFMVLTYSIFSLILHKKGLLRRQWKFLPLYFVFSFHWILVFLNCWKVKSWAESKTEHGD